MKMGVKILGTSAEDVDAAEDRELFDEILEKCEIPRPKGQTVFTAEEAKKAEQCQRHDRNSCYLTDVWYCTAGTWIYLDDINLLIHNNKLNIDQTDDM